MHEFLEDERHVYLNRLARELDQHVAALVAPEKIYDWLKLRIEKIAPADNSGAIMNWRESFELYDAEIARRIALSQLPENERKQFDWPWRTSARAARTTAGGAGLPGIALPVRH